MKNKQEIIIIRVMTEKLPTLWHAGVHDAMSWLLGELSDEDLIELIREEE